VGKKLRRLGSAPASGVAADALVRRREQPGASMGRFIPIRPGMRPSGLQLKRISCGSSADWQSAVSPAGSRQGVGSWGGLEISKSPHETVQVFRSSWLFSTL